MTVATLDVMQKHLGSYSSRLIFFFNKKGAFCFTEKSNLIYYENSENIFIS